MFWTAYKHLKNQKRLPKDALTLCRERDIYSRYIEEATCTIHTIIIHNFQIMSTISIPKGSLKLAGLLYRPGNTVNKSPAVVVIHPGGGVKEQCSSIYAKKLSEHGYVAIAYDALYQGDSDGLPRFLEDPGSRVSDASAVADYLERLDYVDANHIFVVGVCAGGGYAVAAAKADHRFKAVAIMSPVNMGDGTRLRMLGDGNPAQTASPTLDHIADMVRSEIEGSEPIAVPIIPPMGEDPAQDMKDTHEYYLTSRGQHPNSQNKMLLRSVPLIMTWDAWVYADILLKQPLLIVVGDSSCNKWHADRLFEQLDGKHERMKRIVRPGAYHVDLYDKPEHVDPTIEEIDSLFKSVQITDV